MPSTEPMPDTASGSAAGLAFEPRWPRLIALVAFIIAAGTLCWPMLQGHFLLGDDMYIAGYGFRMFGAETLKATGRVPEWNPYLFGGMPYIAAMHGDIFYPPTLLLRWLLPLATAIDLGFFLHFVLAGCAMYAFLRALRTSWTAALVGGLAYELSGIVASMMSPGHDGKLYLSALAPLAFLGLLRAIRHRRIWGYGLFALVIGFGMFCHYQMTYYLLVACGIWTLYLVFWDPERPAGLRWPIVLASALGAVVLGLAIAAVQALPFIAYIPYSPRAVAGASTGWEYATSYAWPLSEIFVVVLPQFNGVLEHYWGPNFVKLHTEYLGVVVILLAAFGLGDRRRGRLRWGLLAIGILFLLVAWGGHTPFYRLWYEVMPMMKKVRAAGMAFYLPALVTCVYAAFGVDRLLRGDVAAKRILVGGGILGVFALLGVVGVLQPVTEALAEPQTISRAVENAPELQMGSLRLLLVVLVAAGVLWSIAVGRLRGAAATALLAVVTVGDLWSIDRLFFNYHPSAAQLFATDPIIDYLKRVPKPYRVADPQATYRGMPWQGSSILMAYDIQQVLGYHGNELRFYDDLLGGKGNWQYLTTPQIFDLTSIRFLLLQQPQAVPGFHQVVGPTTTSAGSPAVLLERDTVPPYVRVLGSAAKIPDDQIAPTVVDPRFPYTRIALYPDTASVSPAALHGGALPEPAATGARVAEWAPGRMRIEVISRDSTPTYLMVSENWYPDWHATIDGKPAPVLRADNTFLSVLLPPGAREVRFQFHSATYDRGELITIVATVLTLLLLATPLWRRGQRTEA